METKETDTNLSSVMEKVAAVADVCTKTEKQDHPPTYRDALLTP